MTRVHRLSWCDAIGSSLPIPITYIVHTSAQNGDYMCHGLVLGPEGLEPAQPRRIFRCRLGHQADGYVTVLFSDLCIHHASRTWRQYRAFPREASPHVQRPFCHSWLFFSPCSLSRMFYVQTRLLVIALRLYHSCPAPVRRRGLVQDDHPGQAELPEEGEDRRAEPHVQQVQEVGDYD